MCYKNFHTKIYVRKRRGDARLTTQLINCLFKQNGISCCLIKIIYGNIEKSFTFCFYICFFETLV